MLWFLVAVTGCLVGFVLGALLSPWLGLWEDELGDSDAPIGDALAREMGIEV